ncbi:SIR2 family protein [Thiohalobacter thiocyanaticus]|uniref:Uncharacterized protein n=1 Tax=Thiohalobacter thiocyanaticus TaxID=585455 RepID=A0A426QKZ8_9GAMM|nr:SIR2 family protein [Thiohalobacter thiocyanaticus]RRQ22443.1 hypothetical protein D6C00_11155 [Thiohalobacter thiocyanaticus]
MAQVLSLGEVTEDIQKALGRSFQSGNINFLIGSGASMPAIPAAGPVEQEIATLFGAGNEETARLRMYEFLAGIQEPMNALINEDENDQIAATLAQYTECITLIETILSERRTTLLPKQATIFTTNYDLLIEKASIGCPAIKLNDGFTRVPRLDNRIEYSSRNFFNTTYNTGNLYNYKVEIPCINLIKLHGSLSWQKDGDEIVFNVAAKDLLPESKTADEIAEFIETFAVVLPQTAKFRTTLMDRTYYELLRIYANELDRENTLLVTFGFSFGDEHIRDITRRALKNPTLRLIAFAYSEADKDAFAEIFAGHNNVDVIAPTDGDNIEFSQFNTMLRNLLPHGGAAI